MSVNRLTVLLIEDNPGDARLIKEMLLEAGTKEFEIESADYLGSGIARLTRGDIAVVLLDLGLPDSQGLDTLAKVCRPFADVPVVVLTGRDDEEIALEAVRRGAQDYLDKGSVDEKLLVRSLRYAMDRKHMESALRRARDELEKRVEERTVDLLMANRNLEQEIVERNRATEALRESEERFRAIFESAPDIIFLKDVSLRYTHVNPAMETLFATNASEIIMKNADDLFDAEAASYMADVEGRVLKGESIEEVCTTRIKGVPLTFHEIRVPMRDSSGEIVGICGMARDVTDRSRREISDPSPAGDYSSPVMRETLKKAGFAARKNSVVLLLGESGSGKDYLARYIHEHSGHASGPFFSINCAAVAPELAESELFGHERGAFTGATSRKRGLLELAEGGTLLLNEIGELSLRLQAKLLTFLDTRQITRVGGEKAVSVNARLIAATNRDLEQEVANQRFRKDLFYRLNVISITVPPLRERSEDIPKISTDILSKLAKELQLGYVPTINQSAMASLLGYGWPGNVRELRNLLERALILSDGKHFEVESFIAERNTKQWSHTVTLKTGSGLRDVLDEVTKSLCLEAMRRCDGNKKSAASLLGIARDSLYRYLKELGIDSDSTDGKAGSKHNA
ncbi:MAG: sigma-54-dependent Fis family transcriptional regulator [Desulfomonile tiedjei]|uniref:Sigma-54-dependent Fis family transcriptional regulator n=1 Tax=Desulfomonile tiedjei TaxID=2358 RepID=A0A9D6V2L4_9BACT|nr:sigma-54-dependent Fis family transcriptional regulator [Desulfomonile tiedjei]